MEREFSVNFGSYNTWTDWHLIPAARPIVMPPEEKTHDIELPCGNGVIDAAQALTGYPVYKNREGSWDFYIENDIEPFVTIYHKMLAALSGRTLRVSLEEDPAYFYEGKCRVSNPKQNNGHTMVTINYDLKPFRHKFSEVGRTVTHTVNGTKTLFSGNVSDFSDEPVCPKFGVTLSSGTGMTVEFVTPNLRYSTVFTNGTWANPAIMLIPHQTATITAKGNGTIKFQASGGWF